MNVLCKKKMKSWERIFIMVFVQFGSSLWLLESCYTIIIKEINTRSKRGDQIGEKVD